MIFNLAGGGTPDIDKTLDDESKWTAWNLDYNGGDYGTIYYMVTASRIFFKGSTKDFGASPYQFDLPQKIINAVGSKRYEIPVIDTVTPEAERQNFVINYDTSSYLHSLFVSNHRTVKLNSWIDL